MEEEKIAAKETVSELKEVVSEISREFDDGNLSPKTCEILLALVDLFLRLMPLAFALEKPMIDEQFFRDLADKIAPEQK